jgi:hypothetical protein
MLLRKEDYKKLVDASPVKLKSTGKVVTYVLKTSREKTTITNNICNELKVKANELNLWEARMLPPVEQWLKNISDADVVVTDSFHGVVFSIINNTPMVVVDNKHGGIARITSLLKEFGLEDRLVLEADANKFNYKEMRQIDWDDVNTKLELLRSHSAQWLTSAIKGKL